MKINTGKIYDEIILNSKFNIINKLNMMKSTKEFIVIVYNPSESISWLN